MRVQVLEAPEVSIAKLEVTQEDHERRITAIEGLVWKIVGAAVMGSFAGGGTAVAAVKLWSGL